MRREFSTEPGETLETYCLGNPDDEAVAMVVAVRHDFPVHGTHDWAAYIGGVPWPEARAAELNRVHAQRIAAHGEKLPARAAAALFPHLDEECYRA